jgi:hypothetical protein
MSTLVNNRGPEFKAGWSAANMSTALTSDAFRCGDWLSTSIQLQWPTTGTPVGVFSYEASNDSTNGVDGRFLPVTITVDKQPSGPADGDLVDFQGMPWKFIRAKYAPTSGGVDAVPEIFFLGKGKA